MYALQPFQANQRGNSVQISENTIAENVSDPNETPEVIQAVYKLIVAVDIGTTYTKVAWSRTVTPPAEPEAHLFHRRPVGRPASGPDCCTLQTIAA